MAQTIGQRLKTEREQRGLTIADVAHDTRIHADTIRGLEADDYSVFSSSTYARGFLQLYSRHLEVDATDALRDFNTARGSLNSGGFTYLETVSTPLSPSEMILPRGSGFHPPIGGQNRRQPLPIFLTLAVVLLIFMIPVFYFVGERANSLEEATSILKHPLSTAAEAEQPGQPEPEEQADPAADTNPPAVEPVATADDSQSGAPPFTGEHRFPRPLPRAGDTRTEFLPGLDDLDGQPSPILKATPIDPKKSKTAQNGN